MSELERALEQSRRRYQEMHGSGKPKAKRKPVEQEPTNGDLWIARAAGGKRLGQVWGEDGAEALQRALRKWPDLQHVERAARFEP